MSIKSLTLAGALFALLSTSGCYKATFVEEPKAAKAEPTREEWTDHFVFGLVGDENYDTRGICREGVGAVRTGGNVGTGAVSIVTLGIYTPRKVYVTCKDSSRTTAKREERR